MIQMNNSKKIGIGSISLILSILGGMLLVTLISLVILLISLFIGYKYKNDYFAKSGRVIAEVFISLIVVLVLVNLIIF